jgi:hypothetical protein
MLWHTHRPFLIQLVASAAAARTLALSRIKCYLYKGTDNQRIRKIDITKATTLPELFAIVRREYEWPDDKLIELAYYDRDDELVEIGPSTTLEDVTNEATRLMIHIFGEPRVPLPLKHVMMVVDEEALQQQLNEAEGH